MNVKFLSIFITLVIPRILLAMDPLVSLTPPVPVVYPATFTGLEGIFSRIGMESMGEDPSEVLKRNINKDFPSRDIPSPFLFAKLFDSVCVRLEQPEERSKYCSLLLERNWPELIKYTPKAVAEAMTYLHVKEFLEDFSIEDADACFYMTKSIDNSVTEALENFTESVRYFGFLILKNPKDYISFFIKVSKELKILRNAQGLLIVLIALKNHARLMEEKQERSFTKMDLDNYTNINAPLAFEEKPYMASLNFFLLAYGKAVEMKQGKTFCVNKINAATEAAKDYKFAKVDLELVAVLRNLPKIPEKMFDCLDSMRKSQENYDLITAKSPLKEWSTECLINSMVHKGEPKLLEKLFTARLYNGAEIDKLLTYSSYKSALTSMLLGVGPGDSTSIDGSGSSDEKPRAVHGFSEKIIALSERPKSVETGRGLKKSPRKRIGSTLSSAAKALGSDEALTRRDSVKKSSRKSGPRLEPPLEKKAAPTVEEPIVEKQDELDIFGTVNEKYTESVLNFRPRNLQDKSCDFTGEELEIAPEIKAPDTLGTINQKYPESGLFSKSGNRKDQSCDVTGEDSKKTLETKAPDIFGTLNQKHNFLSKSRNPPQDNTKKLIETKSDD